VVLLREQVKPFLVLLKGQQVLLPEQQLLLLRQLREPLREQLPLGRVL